MKKDTFFIKLYDGDWSTVKENDRKAFMECMKGIRAQFADNNEFATKLVEIIPDLEKIEINVSRNRDIDVPFIMCRMKDGDSFKMEIPRLHCIIWAILLESAR